MTKINNNQSPRVGSQGPSSSQNTKGGKEKKGFGKFMDNVADGALKTVSAVAPALPGGQLVKAAADGLQQLKDKTPGGLQSPMTGGANSDQINDMFEMQKQNQAYNMQYMKLQQQAQANNRRFKTMSNLMKVRHDTAKSAINNMRA